MLRRPPTSPLFPYPPLSRSRRLREPLFGDPEQLREPGSPAAPATLDALPSRQIGDRLLVLLQPPGHFRDPEALIRNRRPQVGRSEEHTSELQSPCNLVCRLL